MEVEVILDNVENSEIEQVKEENIQLKKQINILYKVLADYQALILLGQQVKKNN